MGYIKKRDLVQLYIFTHLKEIIETHYGKITWEEFLAKEKERLEKDSGRVVEIRNKEYSRHMAGLFVNDIGVSQEDERRKFRNQ